MILDSLDNANQYAVVHPGFERAFDFLRSAGLADLTPGRHGIDGERLYAVVVKGRGVGMTEAKMEAHRRYIDIQFVQAGTDLCGWLPTDQCRLVRQPYDPKTDCELFFDPAKAWVTLPSGFLAIFFPSDAHAPMACDGEVHKVVVKVAVAWDQP